MKLTLSMIVKNEEHRYLKEVLEAASRYITDAVIIDDASTDNTVALCEEILKDIPHKIIRNAESLFHNEWELRLKQWNETIKNNPDWIIFLDADEIFEDGFINGVKDLMNNQNYDLYSFRLYDFWDTEHYRDDELWCAHKSYKPFLLRYKKDFLYEFNKTNQHCGRMPSNVYNLNNTISNYRVKHYGWAKEADRILKYKRYLELDPNGIYGSLNQYNSILDKVINLVKWTEDE